jgi:hypothetical protein
MSRPKIQKTRYNTVSTMITVTSVASAEDLARPFAEFLPGQPTSHERGRERGDRLLAVGMGRAKVATIPASRGCCTTIRPCPHGASHPA